MMKINISGRSHQNSATQRELGGSVKTSTIPYQCGRGTGQQQTHIFSPEWSPLRTTHCICIKKNKNENFPAFSLSFSHSQQEGRKIFFFFTIEKFCFLWFPVSGRLLPAPDLVHCTVLKDLNNKTQNF